MRRLFLGFGNLDIEACVRHGAGAFSQLHGGGRRSGGGTTWRRILSRAAALVGNRERFRQHCACTLEVEGPRHESGSLACATAIRRAVGQLVACHHRV